MKNTYKFRSYKKLKPETEIINETKLCLGCGRKFPAAGKIMSDGRWFRIEWICERCKLTDVWKAVGVPKYEKQTFRGRSSGGSI